MFHRVQQWLFGRELPPAWRAVQQWCEQRGGVFRATADHAGFFLTWPETGAEVRAEWGASQRPYLAGAELRLRADTGLDPELYALVMPRALLESLERAVFSQFTDGVKTHLDERTPEEVRWLAWSPRLAAAEMGALDETLAAVSNAPVGMAMWLGAGFGAALQAWWTGPTGAKPNFALIAQRGRLTWRVALPDPHSAAMADCLDLFIQALAEIRQLGAGGAAPAAPLGNALAHRATDRLLDQVDDGVVSVSERGPSGEQGGAQVDTETAPKTDTKTERPGGWPDAPEMASALRPGPAMASDAADFDATDPDPDTRAPDTTGPDTV